MEEKKEGVVGTCDSGLDKIVGTPAVDENRDAGMVHNTEQAEGLGGGSSREGIVAYLGRGGVRGRWDR